MIMTLQSRASKKAMVAREMQRFHRDSQLLPMV